MKKKIYVFLFDGYSDWEIAYLTPEIKKNEAFELIYCSKDGKPVVSMGGLRVMPELALSQIDPKEVDLLILPGGTAWEKEENHEIDPLAKILFDEGKTIAAICGATVYMGKQGFLNELQHTSNDLNYLKGMAPEYTGEENYVHSLAVTDGNIITACGIGPIEFAREIFKKVKLYSDSEVEKWFQLFKNGVWSE